MKHFHIVLLFFWAYKKIGDMNILFRIRELRWIILKNRYINDFLLFSCNLESTNKPDHILEVKELVLCEIWWTIKKKNKDDFKVAWQEIQLLLEYHWFTALNVCIQLIRFCMLSWITHKKYLPRPMATQNYINMFLDTL